MLVKVWTELPSGKFSILIAKVFEEKDSKMIIRYLSPTEEKDHGRTIYKYEDQTYEIEDDSVTEYVGSSNEIDLGFIDIGDSAFVKEDDDSDYIPSSSSDGDEEDEEYNDEEDPENYYIDEE
jgi:hypothetical protein